MGFFEIDFEASCLRAVVLPAGARAIRRRVRRPICPTRRGLANRLLFRADRCPYDR